MGIKSESKCYLCSCGKKCTSKSGLTMHQGCCGKTKQESTEIDSVKDAAEAALEAASDDAINEDGPIEFVKRCKKDEIITATRKMWHSVCGRWRVILLISKFGLPNRWLVMRFKPYETWIQGSNWAGWEIMSSHKRREPAFKMAVKMSRDERAAKALVESV